MMCGWDVAGNPIGDTGAVALAKALESGQSQLKNLILSGESMCLAACATRLGALCSGCQHAVGRCVDWRAWVAR